MFRIGSSLIKRDDSKVFFIAEIGINHNGDVELAKKLINIAAEAGADAVKFQKRSVEDSFTSERLDQPYLTKNSWGKTYGEHKHHLELEFKQYKQLIDHAHSLGLLFGCTPCDHPSVQFLYDLGVDFYKCASGDLRNIPLLKDIASRKIPMIISTGMSSMKDVYTIHKLLVDCEAKFAILSCTSTYPTPIEDINLNVIKSYLDCFPQTVIGYSGHELGYIPTIAAVSLGARIIERHITIDRDMRGSDHIASLDPEQLNTVIKGIRDLEKGMGDGIKKIRDSEKPFIEKLCKSIVLAKDIKKGDILNETDLCVKHPGTGISPLLWDSVIGKKTVVELKKDQLLLKEYLE
jgi:sialic acid synthase